MLITFTSKAAADVLMYEEHARPILDLLHKDAKRGVITAAEASQAVSILEAQMHHAKNESANESTEPAQAAHGVEQDEDQAVQPVSFSTRAYPLLEMLRAAQKEGKDVMWGV